MAKTFQDLINEGQAKILGIVSIVPMDDWNADTQYQKLNLVRHNGAAYLAKGGSKNVEPGVTQDWKNSWMLAYLDGILSPDGTYPDLTAGRVMHALMWGNKTYDGSSAQTITAADLGLADVYKPQGSIAFASLPATPNESNYGYVWNITNDFTTDSRFIEGAGKEYSAGTNVGVIEQDGQYYYDILGNFVDLSDYAKIDGNYQEMTVGEATNAQNAANVTSQINGHDISDIFETDGVTVKNATQAQGAGNLIATKLVNGNDLNNCVPATAGITETWYCDSVSVATSLLNTPYAGFSKTFKLETTLLWKNQSTGQIRVTQTLSAGQSDPAEQNVYVRSIDSSSSETTWTAWEEIVSSNGSYPTLGAGYLAKELIVSNGANANRYYKLCTFTSPKITISNSFIFLINGIYGDQPTSYAAESGLLEWDIRSDSNGVVAASTGISILGGNLSTSDFFFVISEDLSTVDLYCYLSQQYGALKITELSNSNLNYDVVFDGTSYTSAPSGAVYAVNRNVARPLFIANDVQAKTPTINTDMALDGGVNPDEAIVGDEVIFYCVDDNNNYTCTGKIKSISGSTPTVTITGVVAQRAPVTSVNGETGAVTVGFTNFSDSLAPNTDSYTYCEFQQGAVKGLRLGNQCIIQGRVKCIDFHWANSGFIKGAPRGNGKQTGRWWLDTMEDGGTITINNSGSVLYFTRSGSSGTMYAGEYISFFIMYNTMDAATLAALPAILFETVSGVVLDTAENRLMYSNETAIKNAQVLAANSLKE